jgi:hypothetical protein
MLWNAIASLRPLPEFLPNLKQIRATRIVGDLWVPLMGVSGANLQIVEVHSYVDSTAKEWTRTPRLLSMLQTTSQLRTLVVRREEALFSQRPEAVNPTSRFA